MFRADSRAGKFRHEVTTSCPSNYGPVNITLRSWVSCWRSFKRFCSSNAVPISLSISQRSFPAFVVDDSGKSLTGAEIVKAWLTRKHISIYTSLHRTKYFIFIPCSLISVPVPIRATGSLLREKTMSAMAVRDFSLRATKRVAFKGNLHYVSTYFSLFFLLFSFLFPISNRSIFAARESILAYLEVGLFKFLVIRVWISGHFLEGPWRIFG